MMVNELAVGFSLSLNSLSQFLSLNLSLSLSLSLSVSPSLSLPIHHAPLSHRHGTAAVMRYCDRLWTDRLLNQTLHGYGNDLLLAQALFVSTWLIPPTVSHGFPGEKMNLITNVRSIHKPIIIYIIMIVSMWQCRYLSGNELTCQLVREHSATVVSAR